MASFEKPKDMKQEVKKSADINVMPPEHDKEYKEHMKRHNMQEKKDHDLSSMLQSNWKKLVDAEHRTNH